MVHIQISAGRNSYAPFTDCRPIGDNLVLLLDCCYNHEDIRLSKYIELGTIFLSHSMFARCRCNFEVFSFRLPAGDDMEYLVNTELCFSPEISFFWNYS